MKKKNRKGNNVTTCSLLAQNVNVCEFEKNIICRNSLYIYYTMFNTCTQTANKKVWIPIYDNLKIVQEFHGAH